MLANSKGLASKQATNGYRAGFCKQIQRKGAQWCHSYFFPRRSYDNPHRPAERLGLFLLLFLLLLRVTLAGTKLYDNVNILRDVWCGWLYELEQTKNEIHLYLQIMRSCLHISVLQTDIRNGWVEMNRCCCPLLVIYLLWMQLQKDFFLFVWWNASVRSNSNVWPRPLINSDTIKWIRLFTPSKSNIACLFVERFFLCAH